MAGGRDILFAFVRKTWNEIWRSREKFASFVFIWPFSYANYGTAYHTRFYQIVVAACLVLKQLRIFIWRWSVFCGLKRKQLNTFFLLCCGRPAGTSVRNLLLLWFDAFSHLWVLSHAQEKKSERANVQVVNRTRSVDCNANVRNILGWFSLTFPLPPKNTT